MSDDASDPEAPRTKRRRAVRPAKRTTKRARKQPAVAGIVAGESLSELAAKLSKPRSRKRGASLDEVAAQLRADAPAPPQNALDLVTPPRPISIELVAGRGHYDRVIAAVRDAQTSVWIATANVKELLVEDFDAGEVGPGGEDSRAKPGKRRGGGGRRDFVSILAILDELAARGVELRLLHAELPSGPFRAAIAEHPRLVGGGLALRRCPRVHLKTVIVDGAIAYIGSANWTGAGLGAKGSGRRNFELGIVTDDGPVLDQVQGLFEQIWSGGECAGCKLREVCPGPLDEVE